LHGGRINIGEGPPPEPVDGKILFHWRTRPSGTEAVLAAIHDLWFGRPHGERGKHPLGPFVEWWQARPVEAQPYRPKVRASLPRLAQIEANDRLRTLPGLQYGEPAREPAQLVLPGMPDPSGTACPSGILRLYDAVGGPLTTQGRGAPWALRLFVGAMLHLPVGQRDGEWRTLRFPLREVEDWLHPGGWDRSNRHKYWHRLPEALLFMRREMGLWSVDGLGWVEILRPTVIPQRPTDPGVEFSIRIPRQAANGDRLDWPRLARYGKDSAALYRAYLVAAEFMGRSARHGQPITHRIAAPLLGPNDKPRRRKGGTTVRKPGKQVPNPAARYVRGLTEADLASLIGFDPTKRYDRYRARKAFERLTEDSAIKLVRTGSPKQQRYRIFGPDPVQY